LSVQLCVSANARRYNTAGDDLRLAFGDGDVLTLTDFSRVDFTAGDVLL
jgi:hypothetical protein